MPQKPVPAIGEDVTDLMPPVGADVTDMMGDVSVSPAAPAPPKGSAASAYARIGRPVVDAVSNNLSTIGGIAGGIVGGVVGNVPGAVAGAALGAGGGEGWQQVVDYFKGKPTPKSENAAVGQIAKQAAIGAGSELVGAGLGKGMTKAAPWLMEKALKPTQALLKEYQTKAPKLVQTLLDEGVSVTQGGVDKLQRLFDATNAEIKAALTSRDELLKRMHGRSDVVSRPRVAAQVATTAKRTANQVDPSADLEAIGGVTERFLKPPVNPGNLTLPEAQAMKIGTYREIGKKYGEISSATIEAQKALARGLKDEIAAEVPLISELNKADSELMAALDAVGRQVALAGRKDPVGFAWVASHPVSFMAALFDRNPAVKSLVARGLYTTAGTVAKVSPQLIKAAVGAIAQQASPAPVESPPPQ